MSSASTWLGKVKGLARHPQGWRGHRLSSSQSLAIAKARNWLEEEEEEKEKRKKEKKRNKSHKIILKIKKYSTVQKNLKVILNVIMFFFYSENRNFV